MRAITFRILLAYTLTIIILLMPGCDSRISDNLTDDIALIQSGELIVDRDLLVEIAAEFYADHPDEYDMLVLWGSSEFAPGTSYYLPVINDVTGIGYGHYGDECFNFSAEFSSNRLQGIIWMGPYWVDKLDGLGPESTLGILAHETLHRWGAYVYFYDDNESSISDDLIGITYHWSFFLDSGASPLGGNDWKQIGDSLFTTAPVDYVEFSQLDLYLMGLIEASEVEPIRLLTNVRDENGSVLEQVRRLYKRASGPMTVIADLVEIPIDRIIEAVGIRNPQSGFNASEIKQAWIYVYPESEQPSDSDLAALKQLQNQWEDYFNQASGGRSLMITDLNIDQ